MSSIRLSTTEVTIDKMATLFHRILAAYDRILSVLTRYTIKYNRISGIAYTAVWDIVLRELVSRRRT